MTVVPVGLGAASKPQLKPLPSVLAACHGLVVARPFGWPSKKSMNHALAGSQAWPRLAPLHHACSTLGSFS